MSKASIFYDKFMYYGMVQQIPWTWLVTTFLYAQIIVMAYLFSQKTAITQEFSRIMAVFSISLETTYLPECKHSQNAVLHGSE